MALDPTHRNFPKLLDTKKTIMASILTASVRVNNQSLRAKNEDKIAHLLEEVKAAGQPAR